MADLTPEQLDELEQERYSDERTFLLLITMARKVPKLEAALADESKAADTYRDGMMQFATERDLLQAKLAAQAQLLAEARKMTARIETILERICLEHDLAREDPVHQLVHEARAMLAKLPVAEPEKER